MSKLKRIAFVLALLAFFFATGNRAQSGQFACLPNNSYFSPYWSADAVFVGLGIKTSTENGRPFVALLVEKAFRGTNDKKIEIISESANRYAFQEGERYFVYAYRGGDGKLYVGNCSATVSLKDAAEDLEYAQEIASGKTGNRIRGYIYEDKRDSYKDARRSLPLAGIEVTITDKKRKFTTRTDAKGKYVFKEVPAGHYKVEAKVPPGFRELIYKPSFMNRSIFIGEDFELTFLNNLRKPVYRHVGGENFLFTAQSSVGGKVAGHDGQNPPQQFIWLLPVDENGKAILDSPTEYVWTNPENGEFYFNAVPAGKYLLSINRYGCHQNRNPEYDRTFFPGVADEGTAQIITVGQNRQIKLADFRLLPPLKETWISGTVLAADKTPLAGASVFLWNKRHSTASECFGNAAEATTDESGRFRVKGYENYVYKIRAFKAKNQEPASPRLYSKILDIPLTVEIKDMELIVDSTQ
ncbi:MAG TPA: carboxypeptidase-like regulatory domain-containing protein [Pyrinomonadaceae bacterium]|jgi:hypothetical protein